MIKMQSIRRGQIWLHVFKTDDGGTAITINKSYPTTQGWKQTNFLRPDSGDIKCLLEALQELYEMNYNQKGKTPFGMRGEKK